MKIADVHCHLDMPQLYEDIDEVIDNAREEGVECIITNGTSPESNRKVLELTDEYDIVEPALGIYPGDALDMSYEEIDEELDFIREQKPIAVGECGLDYSYDEYDEEKMKYAFREQLELAEELDVPVIIHSRKAEGDCIELVEESGHDKVVMHCFSGRKHQIKKVVENGWYLSIPAIVVKLEHFQMAADIAEEDQLLTETDAPFLSPYSNVKRNESAFIRESIPKIAEIKERGTEEMSRILFENFEDLFL